MAHKGQENLIPMNKRSEDEVRELGQKGGIRSGEVRREKATMKATLEKLLDEKNKKGITYRDMATLGLIQGAVKGNAQNYRTILEILGELGQQADESQINTNINNIAELINNPVENRTEENMDE